MNLPWVWTDQTSEARTKDRNEAGASSSHVTSEVVGVAQSGDGTQEVHPSLLDLLVLLADLHLLLHHLVEEDAYLEHFPHATPTPRLFAPCFAFPPVSA